MQENVSLILTSNIILYWPTLCLIKHAYSWFLAHTLCNTWKRKTITPVESVHAPRLFAANLEINSCEISKTANDTVTTTYRTMFSPRTPSQRTGSSPFNMTPRANKSMQNRRVSSIFTPQSQKKGRYDIFIQHNVVCKH